MSKIKIAIVGATGLVGQTFLNVIKDDINKYEIKLYASSKSNGKRIKINNKFYYIHPLDTNSFDDVDYACFFTEASISKDYIPIALKHNVKVIDNSSYYRMEEKVPLVVAGVNDDYIKQNDSLIANPNCCVIQCMILLSLLKKYKIKSISYNTYQSVSGSGKKGIDDLLRCRKGLVPLFYETDISFTCIPKIGEYNNNLFTDEENKMIEETRKILDEKSLDVVATCVRVPVMFSHGVSIDVELNEEFNIDQIKNDFSRQKNIVVCEKIIPTSILSCKNDKVYVGRIRKHNNRLLMYCVADNIRVGAATNAYNILKKLINQE